MENLEYISNKIEQLSDLKQKISNILQDQVFDFVGFRKFQDLQKKASLFRFDGKVYVGSDLRNARPLHQHIRFELLQSSNHNWIDFKPSAGSIVLMTNNDIGSNLPKYIKCYENNVDSLFIIWDWDSQHWTYMSSMLGLHSDFYISGGSENTFFSSHFNPAVIGPIWGGVHQWSRDFIIENISILLRDRNNAPLGVHFPYENFSRRNRAIATVTKKFPTVRFGNNDYKSKTDLENFHEWSEHKTHWVMPVMGGLPLRGYNAMLTGGIPILPSFLKNFPEVSILGNIPLYYEVSDLIEPEAIHWAGVEKFDKLGRDGVLQRVLDGLSKYHIDARCESILQLAELSLERIRNGDRSYPDGYYSVK
jgi:hypothetical protein